MAKVTSHEPPEDPRCAVFEECTSPGRPLQFVSRRNSPPPPGLPRMNACPDAMWREHGDPRWVKPGLYHQELEHRVPDAAGAVGLVTNPVQQGAQEGFPTHVEAMARRLFDQKDGPGVGGGRTWIVRKAQCNTRRPRANIALTLQHHETDSRHERFAGR